ncbi:type II toxin-antitoxin system HicB family antitoxin [Pelagibacterium xiamenense]|uniref:type II toxin-antitoxin system HicB family antitoxin n=1 Tax=Pelagibacterium xiamenense TaxID=2901140 RepID=UPI001E4C4D80|nr:type II toxin-antitoxin system HicB family antitoxin [Pelagibacterium xiamenense]MCD7059228.1 type II toxin-antitoxin system HicB family antitoxin [Pelagibacterium xiamenense]
MSSVLGYKGYKASVAFDADDEIFFGRILGINDVVGFHADTVADLKLAFAEAVEDYLESCKKVGKSPEKAYSGNLMLRIDPAVHSQAAMAAESAGMSLNQWSEEALKKATEHAR